MARSKLTLTDCVERVLNYTGNSTEEQGDGPHGMACIKIAEMNGSRPRSTISDCSKRNLPGIGLSFWSLQASLAVVERALTYKNLEMLALP